MKPVPFRFNVLPFFDLSDAIEPRNYLRDANAVTFLLYLSHITVLVKLEYFNYIISIIISDFVFLTAFRILFPLYDLEV